MKTLTFNSCTLGIVISLSACGVDPVVLGEIIEGAGSGDDAPVPADPSDEDLGYDLPIADPNAPGSRVGVVVDILLQYCGECHEAPADEGGLSVISDVQELVARGLMIPGSKEDSPIYTRMVNGTMPPYYYEGARPLELEIELVGSFIDDIDGTGD
jgi:hypothetical protein